MLTDANDNDREAIQCGEQTPRLSSLDPKAFLLVLQFRCHRDGRSVMDSALLAI